MGSIGANFEKEELSGVKDLLKEIEAAANPAQGLFPVAKHWA
jgi:hypothetical protein